MHQLEDTTRVEQTQLIQTSEPIVLVRLSSFVAMDLVPHTHTGSMTVGTTVLIHPMKV